jgi:hypothetical protein
VAGKQRKGNFFWRKHTENIFFWKLKSCEDKAAWNVGNLSFENWRWIKLAEE